MTKEQAKRYREICEKLMNKYAERFGEFLDRQEDFSNAIVSIDTIRDCAAFGQAMETLKTYAQRYWVIEYPR